MSGKRHHFVPQFIQRGFASHYSGDDAFVWVYRSDRPPFNTNVKNVGVEGDFYSDGVSNEVDDAITAAETDLARLVAALRASSDDDALPSDEIAHLVAHLEVRSRHLRQNFEFIGGVAIQQVLDFLADEERFGAFALRQMERDNSVFLEAIEQDLRQRGLPTELAPMVLKLSKPLLPALMPGVAADFVALASKLRDQVPAMVETAARNGQLRSLKSALAPPDREERYASLSYRTITLTQSHIPLGDSMVVFHLDGEREYRSFTQVDDRILAVILPLSPTRLLLGHEAQYDLDEKGLPLTIAACSLEHYIAAERSEHLESLVPRLGTTARVFTQAEIEGLMVGAFAAED
jgi:hypothetical protein